ncbi:hypothetical protein SUGI_0001730 [Cryptomeria japonica]|nr:hypothetical protein SUGI_0001730 [Cryptomeria japonica]
MEPRAFPVTSKVDDRILCGCPCLPVPGIRVQLGHKSYRFNIYVHPAFNVKYIPIVIHLAAMASGRIIAILAIIFLITFLGLASTEELSAQDFPPGFIFGVGSAAYQYEGAAAEDGRKPSIWDTFVHIKGNTVDGSTGDVAVDQYHRYKEDVELMSKMGVDGYKLSISWSRLIPDGNGPINPKGLQYYNNLINELVAQGIQPHVILNHFDLPQALEDAYEGFISPQIVKDFTAYADICFREFGDRVKFWSTFNEPNVLSIAGYDMGGFAPQRCSYPFGNCTAGNSTVEPYIVAHNVLIAHAAAVELYREKYQGKQKGCIGLALLMQWAIPLTNKSTDIAAAERHNDFSMGWFLDPIAHGDYPVSMRKIAGSRLPLFTEEQIQKIQGSLDFIGINYYFSFYCYDVPNRGVSKLRDYIQDMSVGYAEKQEEFTINNMGIQAVLEYIKNKYHNPPVIVYENGISGNGSMTLPQALSDQYRVNFHLDVLKYVLAAIRNGSNINGYFIWSLLDDFEVFGGYTISFGLHHVDFNDNLKRYPKLSAQWYKTFLQTRGNKKPFSDAKSSLLNNFNVTTISLE